MKIRLILIITAAIISGCSVKKGSKTEMPPQPRTIDKNNTAQIIDAKRQQLYSMNDISMHHLLSVIKADSLHDVAHYEVAKEFFAIQDVKNAVYHAKTAYNLNKENFWYAILYAELLEKQNNFKETWELYQLIINKWGDNPDIWNVVWIFLEKNKKYDLLNKTLEKYEKKFGYNNDILILRYQVFIQENKMKKVEEYLVKTISRESNNIMPYLILGEHYLGTNRDHKANEIYDKALKIDKNNPDALLGKVKIYLKQEDYNNAFNVLELIFINPDITVETKIGIFVTMAQEAEINKKINPKRLNDLTISLYNQYNMNPDIRYFHGNLMYQEKKFKEAVEDFSFSLNDNPNNLQLWFFTIYLLEELKDYKRLLNIADSAIMFFPGQKDLFIARGFAHRQLKNYEKSLEDFNFALKITGNNDKDRNHVLHYISEINYQLGNYEETFKFYDEILKKDNNDIVALNNYAYYLSVKNLNLEKALEMSLKTIKAEPTNSTYLDTYAYILFKLEKYPDALKYIELAIKNGGTRSAVILEHYGDILYMNNQVDFAVSTWKEAKELKNEKQDEETSDLLDKKIELKQYIDE